MAFLLADAAKLTQDMLLRGVIETIITESHVLQHLPFMGVGGSGLDYNQELTLPTAQWHAVNDTWVQSEPTYQQQKSTLAILGGDADVDTFLQQTYANRNDIEAIVTQSKAKAVAYGFNAAFFYGDHTGTPNQFDGLATQAGTAVALTAMDATHRAGYAGANGAALTLDMMDAFIDQVKPGRPDALFMSKRQRRKLSSLRRASGNLLQTALNEFGQAVISYDGIPILIDENIPDNEAQGTSGAVCSSIFAVQWGAGTKVSGLQNGGITVQRLAQLETKDASRTRIKWYTSLAIFNNWSYAVLRGINGS